MRWKPAVVLLALASSTFPLTAQSIVSTEPALPTSVTPVTLVISDCDCPGYGPAIRDGFVINLQWGTEEIGCPAACLSTTFTVPVGLLPAGTYTVRRFVGGTDPADGEIIGSFIVGEATGLAVPALEGWGVVALVVLLATLALRRLHGLTV